MGADALKEQSRLAAVLEEGGGRWDYLRARDGGRFALELKRGSHEETAQLLGLENSSDAAYDCEPGNYIVLEGQDAKYGVAVRLSNDTPKRVPNQLPVVFKVIFDAESGKVLGIFESSVVGGVNHGSKKIDNDVAPKVIEALVEEILQYGLAGNDTDALTSHRDIARQAERDATDYEMMAGQSRVKAKQYIEEFETVVAKLRTRFDALGLELEDVLKVQIGEGAVENLPK